MSTYASTPSRPTLSCPSDFPLRHNSCSTEQGLICQHSSAADAEVETHSLNLTLSLPPFLQPCLLTACQSSELCSGTPCRSYAESSSCTGGIKVLDRAVSEITLFTH